jgi:hypothetical protein
MIVGLPGAGISAFFYLFLVLLMPFKLAWNAARRVGVRPDQARLIARQLLIGAGILASFAVIGAVLAVLLPQPAPVTGPAAAAGGTAIAVERGIARVGVYLGIATLIGVLAVTQLLALTVRRSTPARFRGRASAARLVAGAAAAPARRTTSAARRVAGRGPSARD